MGATKDARRNPCRQAYPASFPTSSHPRATPDSDDRANDLPITRLDSDRHSLVTSQPPQLLRAQTSPTDLLHLVSPRCNTARHQSHCIPSPSPPRTPDLVPEETRDELPSPTQRPAAPSSPSRRPPRASTSIANLNPPSTLPRRATTKREREETGERRGEGGGNRTARKLHHHSTSSTCPLDSTRCT